MLMFCMGANFIKKIHQSSVFWILLRSSSSPNVVRFRTWWQMELFNEVRPHAKHQHNEYPPQNSLFLTADLGLVPFRRHFGYFRTSHEYPLTTLLKKIETGRVRYTCRASKLSIFTVFNSLITISLIFIWLFVPFSIKIAEISKLLQ